MGFWYIFDNPEFSRQMLPSDLKPEILKKYQIGDVFVKPILGDSIDSMDRQKLHVIIFSQTKSPVVAVNSIEMLINGRRLEDYGTRILNKSLSDWEVYSSNSQFYMCSFTAEPFNKPKINSKKVRIIITIEVSVISANGNHAKKEFEITFIPVKYASMGY